jgi:hypothetical protein
VAVLVGVGGGGGVAVVAVGSRMQDELLPWLLLHCPGMPQGAPPQTFNPPPPPFPSTPAVPSLALLIPAVLLRSWGVPLVRNSCHQSTTEFIL